MVMWPIWCGDQWISSSSPVHVRASPRMRATSSIPIVTIVAPDPIGMGLAQSLARPGGNITGLTTMDLDIYGKRLELLGQAVPGLRKAAILVSSDKPMYRTGSPWASAVSADARSLGLTLHIVEADETNFDGALSSLVADWDARARRLLRRHLPRASPTACRHHDPPPSASDFCVSTAGGRWWSDGICGARRRPFAARRFLRGSDSQGAKPADLPIEQPTRFTLVLNLRTAKNFGLDLPAVLLAASRRGDRVMRRREFMTLLGGAAAAWPMAGRAQQSERKQRFGVLMSGAEDDPETQARLVGIRQGLARLGWSEGRNLQIDYRYASASPEKAQAYAKELVTLQPDVILAPSQVVAAVLQRETRVVPIVFVGVADPIGAGLIASLARPGGNLTGTLLNEPSVVEKWLALLKEAAPKSCAGGGPF